MNKVSFFNSADELAIAAADLIVKLASDSIRNTGRFTIALSGGNTPGKLYALLATPTYKEKIDWKKTFIFWGDERCVPADSKDNNSHNAKVAFLDHVPLPKENIFPVDTTLSPVDAAKNYQQTLKDFFRNDHPKFDLILLGMGDNGHTASLFPHTPILHEKKALVKEVHVPELNADRISFTVPLINDANHILFLVAGKEKQSMLDIVLEGAYEPEKFPAQLIKEAEWFVSL